ncbi:MAG: substrate-binding domain-containing protein [Defluviitaleaceae bacterium]|nr:substrate-binding domain-containing protein [Defluviitaleaceae bacterium]
MSKPIMQDIASSLSVSRVSVWKALTDRPGISEELRGKILSKAQEIGYVKEADLEIKPPARTIATVVSRPESSIFWMQIIHQIAEELSTQGVNMLYTHLPPSYEGGDALPAVLNDGSVSGIIVLNIYCQPHLKMLSELPVPKVFLDSIPSMPYNSLNGDLVLIEGRAAIRQIAGALLDNGKKCLGFVGDVNYAQTNMDRFHGFQDAHIQRGLVYDESLTLTGHLQLNKHYEQISVFLSSLIKSGRMPDGFVCASDYIAHFIQRYFTEYGIKDVALTGFDNNAEYVNVANRITTVDVLTKSMGERLANKIMFAVNHPNTTSEVCYVTSKVLYRGLPG